MVGRPPRRGVGVVGGRGPRVLGSEAVVDRHHDRAHRVGQATAPTVVAVQVADDPPAAVEVHDAGLRAVTDERPVDPDRDRPVGTRDRRVLHPSDGFYVRDLRERLGEPARLGGRRDRVHARERLLEDLDEGRRSRIDRHRRRP